MKWILIGTILGSLIMSQHETEEACMGRKALLAQEKSATELQCIERSGGQLTIGGGGGNYIVPGQLCCLGDGTCRSC